jgi:hypothetical protein
MCFSLSEKTGYPGVLLMRWMSASVAMKYTQRTAAFQNADSAVLQNCGFFSQIVK